MRARRYMQERMEKVKKEVPLPVPVERIPPVAPPFVKEEEEIEFRD